MKAPQSREGSAFAFGALGRLAETGLQNAVAIGRLIDGLKTAADAGKETAVQRTERERIRRSKQIEAERIRAARDVLLRGLDRAFDERRANFDALFAQLDRAMAQGNPEAVSMTLDAVVKLARSSPFKDLVDVAKAREAVSLPLRFTPSSAALKGR
jgi:hypothetical protein